MSPRQLFKLTRIEKSPQEQRDLRCIEDCPVLMKSIIADEQRHVLTSDLRWRIVNTPYKEKYKFTVVRFHHPEARDREIYSGHAASGLSRLPHTLSIPRVLNPRVGGRTRIRELSVTRRNTLSYS